MSASLGFDLQVYNSIGLKIDTIMPEKESIEYNACTFNLNGLKILFRSAKITPTKNGQFVTLWKRRRNGPIMPFDGNDAFDFIVINVNNSTDSGQFVFPKAVLCARKIFSNKGLEGKRAFRIYAPWDIAQSKQAAQTQKWQTDYFLEIKDNAFVNEEKAKLCYTLDAPKTI